MAIVVVTERNSDGTFQLSKRFQTATQAVVLHGHLRVARRADGDLDELGSFAPGSWVSWSRDGVAS
jgi:hypothetical protein